MENPVIYTMVSKSMNTKFIATFAVLAMMLAGVGAFFVAEANDAEDETPAEPTATATLTIRYGGTIDAATVDKLVADGFTIKYTTTLVDDYEDKITILNYETFKALRTLGVISITTVTFAPDALDKGIEQIVDGVKVKVSSYDFIDFLKTFTEVDVSAAGEIKGGVGTALILPLTGEDDADVTLDVTATKDAEAAIVAAVALAVAETEAQYADYKSPAEVEEAIKAAVADLSVYIYTQEDMDKAIADAKAAFDGYMSPDDVKKAVDKAVEDYKATNPVKTDDTYLYMFIVALAIAIVLAGIIIFTRVIQPRLKAAGKI